MMNDEEAFEKQIQAAIKQVTKQENERIAQGEMSEEEKKIRAMRDKVMRGNYEAQK